jgi:porphobilinogen synthase
MDPRNSREAVKEAMRDLEEGADIIMVKPALAYLDVISLLKQRISEAPLAAYNVSGEYMLIKAGSKAGVIDEELAVMEVLVSIRRAGADLIITYHALEAAEALRRGYAPF